MYIHLVQPSSTINVQSLSTHTYHWDVLYAFPYKPKESRQNVRPTFLRLITQEAKRKNRSVKQQQQTALGDALSWKKNLLSLGSTVNSFSEHRPEKLLNTTSAEEEIVLFAMKNKSSGSLTFPSLKRNIPSCLLYCFL